MLGDKGNRVAAEFGLVFTLPQDLREVYRNFGIDLERFNGDDSWTLPMPGRFILNQQSKIVSAEVHPDYTERPEPAGILAVLESHPGARTL